MPAPRLYLFSAVFDTVFQRPDPVNLSWSVGDHTFILGQGDGIGFSILNGLPGKEQVFHFLVGGLTVSDHFQLFIVLFRQIDNGNTLVVKMFCD